MGGLAIVPAGRERIAALEPLWVALHRHHAVVGASIGPTRDPGDSWRRRRAEYERWLRADARARVLLAEDARGRALGYAMVRFGPASFTWDTGEPTAALETLVVLPEARGRGVGHALLAAARAHARAQGAQVLGLGVVAANRDAIRFYEREGFRPAFLELVSQL